MLVGASNQRFPFHIYHPNPRLPLAESSV
jgi:hypothetical protein